MIYLLDSSCFFKVFLSPNSLLIVPFHMVNCTSIIIVLTDRSYSSVYDLGRVRSNSPAQQTSRRGILKNGKSLLRGSHLRERSCSPVLQHQQRPHSPPTRLSPRSVSPRSRSPGSRSLGSSSPRSRPHHSLLGRSYSTTCLDKSVWRDVEKENTLYCDPQLSSMKRKAWYELQM